MNVRATAKSVSDFFRTDAGKTVLKWIQRVINVGVLLWLAFELTEIGWTEVWKALPTQPLFYLLFLGMFFQLPLFEILIYRITWTFDALKSVPIFLLKSVYNKDVLGYSGEVYFFLWARNRLDHGSTEVFKIIKDNNIISSVASTLFSLALLSVFLFTDQIKILERIAGQNQIYFYAGILLVVIAILLFIRFRHFVISMPLNSAYKIFFIQIFRLFLIQVFNLLMYYIVLPDTPLYVWFTYIAVEIILSRIPFLPNRDLIFTGMGITMAEGLMVSPSAIAGLMVARAVLGKVSTLVSFGISHMLKDSDIVPRPGQSPKELSYSELNDNLS